MLTRKQLYRKTIRHFQNKKLLVETDNRYTDLQSDSTNTNQMDKKILKSKENTKKSENSIEKIKSIRFNKFVYVKLIPTKEEHQKYYTI